MGRDCSLQLLQALTIAVILWSESLRTRDHILLFSNLRVPEPGGPDLRIYVPMEQGDPVILSDTGLRWR
jgi:hypothetical protein